MKLFARLPHLLVRYRIHLFLLMTVLAVGSGMLVPHININTDMTHYLPDDSPMKQGMDVVATYSPELDAQVHQLGASFGDASNLMPKELPKALTLGVILVVVVLLVMCASVLDVLLILASIGYAVVLNMGTNALLPSVAMITNSLSAVLQMVLSLDYCIILINRYRQERAGGLAAREALEASISHAAGSILSSASTTVASLLMLVFIKLKIGADLGVVLAKGVMFSLICNFTVMPALIIWADKALMAARKKIPALPAAAFARFQHKFRVPLAVFFILAFGASAILQRRTPLAFSPQFDSEASEVVHDGNPIMLIFATAEEDAVPPMLERLAADPKVTMTASWPTTLGRSCTADELLSMLSELGGGTEAFPEDLLRVVYYARMHPERDGKLSFSEVEAAANELAGKGLVPDGFDRNALMKRLMPPAPQAPAAPKTPPVVPAAPDSTQTIPDTLAAALAPVDSLAAAAPDSLAAEMPQQPEATPGYSYEEATTPLDAATMAERFGAERSQMTMLYRLAGKARGKMSPYEMASFVRDRILTNRTYAAMVPQDMKERFGEEIKLLEAAVAAGPPAPVELPAPADSLVAAPHDTLAAVLPVSPADTLSRPEPEPVIEEELPEELPTPLERLAEMAFSSRKYSSERIQSALSAAGVPVTRDEMDLLFLYALSRRDYDESWTMTPVQLLDYVADTLLVDPALSRFIEAPMRAQVDSARNEMRTRGALLRGPEISAAAVITNYAYEAPDSFDFVQQALELADETLTQKHYWIGESVMYKELKDGFPRELTLLTVLTVLAIFLIVALNFRSLLVPIPLILCILTGVYIDVIAAGFSGNSMFYLAYLVVQGILMGATIDYAILFASYFRAARQTQDTLGALEAAYRGASHSIMTSGLILTLVPWVMSAVLKDAMMVMILRSLGIGAGAVLLLNLFVLPGVLAATMRKKKPTDRK